MNENENQKTILVVEDDESINLLIQKSLQREGFHTESSFNGKDAIDKIIENPDIILLLDYLLPDMNGEKILNVLTKKKLDVPFIIMTGHGDEKIAVEIMKMGARDYIVKDPGFIYVLPEVVKKTIKELEKEERLAKTEKALKKSERKYRFLYKESPIINMIIGMDGTIKDVNKSTLTTLGYTRDELIGKHTMDFVVPKQREKVDEQLERAFKGEYTTEIDVDVYTKNGSIHTILFSPGSVILYEDNNPAGILLTGIDITERKRAEEEITQSEEKYRSLFENMLNGFTYCKILVDKDNQPTDFVHLEVNDAWERLIGLKKEDIVGKKVTEAIPGIKESETDLISIYGKVALAGEEVKFDLYFDPLEKWFTISVYSPQKGYFVAVFEDITERKRTEQIQSVLYNITNAVHTTKETNELYSSIKDYLSKIIDTKNFYIALYYKDQDLISFDYYVDEFVDEKDNTKVTRKLGKGLTEYVIRTGKSLLATEKVLEKLVNSGEVEMIGAPSKIWLGVPLKIENEVIGVVAVQSYTEPNLYSEKDVGILEFVSDTVALAIERKQAEEQIKKDLKEKEVMLKEIYHRVKNNMQIIVSLINLQSRNIKNKNVREILNICKNRIFSMSLIHEKLYSSKDLARIDFNSYIRSLTSYLLQLTRDIVSNIKIDINAKDVFLDINTAIPCGMIINELVSNALKYAFPKGRKGKLTIEMYKDGEGKNNLIVQDDGIGFPKDIDFRETESLGLRLVTSLTKQLEGTVKLERDRGTRFKVVF